MRASDIIVADSFIWAKCRNKLELSETRLRLIITDPATQAVVATGFASMTWIDLLPLRLSREREREREREYVSSG